MCLQLLLSLYQRFDFTDHNNWGYKNLKSTTVYDMNRVNMEVESEVLKAKSQSFFYLGPYMGEMTRQKNQPAKRGEIYEAPL